ncbi:MAG: hypothetical protein JSV22_01330 [Bacteroidales bacterium]|nr:MAG: hypothetical protein JSV22_01330 [Bacteroidales bacterium]
MSEKRENIDRFFKNKLENYEEIPGPVVWDKISEKLGHKKERRLVFFIGRVAAGITLVIALGLAYHYLNKDTSGELTETTEQSGDQVKEEAVSSPGRLAESEAGEIHDRLVESETGEVQGRLAESEAGEVPGKKEIAVDEVSNEVDIDKYEELISAGQTTETDNFKSRIILSRIKAIIIDKIENIYTDDTRIAERSRKKGAEEHLMHTDYIAEDEITYDDEKPVESKWTIGGQLAPLYSYRNVSSDYLDSYVKDQINAKESGIISYAVGLNVAMSPGKRLSIRSGIYYSKYGQQTDAVSVFASNTPQMAWNDQPQESTTNVLISQSIGTVSNNNVDLKFNQAINSDAENQDELRYFSSQNTTDVQYDASATQYFEYLEIPLIIKYKIIDRKIDLNVLSGISTHFLIGNDIYLDYDNMSDRFPENVNVNNMNYSGSLGIGIEYPILSKLMLNVEPRFKYYLNPLVRNPSYNIHPYSLGVFTGISYVF